MLVLRYSPASPYARKIRIAADILGLTDRIEIQGADTSDPKDNLRQQNPLGKIPVLILENGESLYDSRVIAEYIDDLAGGGDLFPLDRSKRFDALNLQALGDGINDAALLIRYETAQRPEALRSEEFIALQSGKVERALALLEAAPPAGEITIGHIAVATALGYQDLRFEGAWRASHPRLVEWLATFASVIPSFNATGV